MSGFREDWLDLREPADIAARDADLLQKALNFAETSEASTVTDIGSGTGSTLRTLHPVLKRRLRWQLVDHDQSLLDVAKERHGARVHVDCVKADLNDMTDLDLTDTDLMTASALFDLCSKEVIENLAKTLKSEEVGLYAALNFDGRIEFDAGHPHDDAVVAAFNAHQRGDKGMGIAAGPQAADVLQAAFSSVGHLVETAHSDWVLDTTQNTLHRAFVEGMANAVREAGTMDESALTEWLEFRLSKAGQAGLRVGHVDVLALPK